MAGKRRKKKKSSKAGVIAVSLVVMLLFSVLAYKSIELREKNEDYIEREQDLRERLAEQQERESELAEYEKYVQTKKYVEEIAREKLGLVYENEIIFKPEK